jgi:hypothetical protein
MGAPVTDYYIVGCEEQRFFLVENLTHHGYKYRHFAEVEPLRPSVIHYDTQDSADRAMRRWAVQRADLEPQSQMQRMLLTRYPVPEKLRVYRVRYVTKIEAV